MENSVHISERIDFRKATSKDIVQIMQLYHAVYLGSYPDERMTNYQILSEFLEGQEGHVYIASRSSRVIACTFFQYDPINQIAKAFGAVVVSDERGQNLTQRVMEYGIDQLKSRGLDLVYATTRTVHPIAQVLTNKMGFKQLGVFPNVHKTDSFETHLLVGLYLNNSLGKRLDDLKIHPKIKELFQIVNTQVPIGDPIVDDKESFDGFIKEIPDLEIIFAPKFVSHRLESMVYEKCVDLAFYPFHHANTLITDAKQDIEIFAQWNKSDGHCVIIGAKIANEICYQNLFLKVAQLLENVGVRYIELITRADRYTVIDRILKSKFIPCGYLPAFQFKENIRHDYVIFSRSFEILDFSGIELTGIAKDLLQTYYRSWKDVALGPALLKDETHHSSIVGMSKVGNSKEEA